MTFLLMEVWHVQQLSTWQGLGEWEDTNHGVVGDFWGVYKYQIRDLLTSRNMHLQWGVIRYEHELHVCMYAATMLQ